MRYVNTYVLFVSRRERGDQHVQLQCGSAWVYESLMLGIYSFKRAQCLDQNLHPTEVLSRINRVYISLFLMNQFHILSCVWGVPKILKGPRKSFSCLVTDRDLNLHATELLNRINREHLFLFCLWFNSISSVEFDESLRLRKDLESHLPVLLK